MCVGGRGLDRGAIVVWAPGSNGHGKVECGIVCESTALVQDDPANIDSWLGWLIERVARMMLRVPKVPYGTELTPKRTHWRGVLIVSSVDRQIA